MAAPNNVISGAGFRHLRFYALDTDGTISATGTTAYSGVHLGGVMTLTITSPTPRTVDHIGDDRVFAKDLLPPGESASATLSVSKFDANAHALVTGTKVATLAETKLVGEQTSKQGFEPQVCILAWRQSVDTTPGASNLRRWEYRIIPVAQIMPQADSFEDSAGTSLTFDVNMGYASAYPWGVAFSETTNGFASAQAIRGIANYPPIIDAFQLDDTATTVTLSQTLLDENSMAVFVNGVADAGATAATTDGTTVVTPSAAVEECDKIIVFYQYGTIPAACAPAGGI